MVEEPVDALEAIIAYLRTDVPLSDLVSDRIASKHRFALGDDRDGTTPGWPTPAKALALSYEGADGDPDPINCVDAAQERVRLAARCYGETPLEASRVWRRLTTIARSFTRATVVLDDGRTALVFWLWPAEGPFAEQDPDTRVDTLRLTLRVAVARTALTP
jgi:hypothetical protein